MADGLSGSLAETDRCVQCGLCLPHCPTYIKTESEADSPRGRIALMQALRLEQLPASPSLESHLERCLTCRACEQVCPSQVPYGSLIDAARSALRRRRPRGLRRRLAETLRDRFMGQPERLAPVLWLLYLYQRTGLAWLVQRLHLARLVGLGHAERLLPRLTRPWRPQNRYPGLAAPNRETPARVALFQGCVARAMDPVTLQASIALLTAEGIDVDIPAQQTCCGALHAHDGAQEQAAALAQRNATAFGGVPARRVLFSASGCGAVLREPPGIHSDDSPVRGFAATVDDILGYVVRRGFAEPLLPVARRVALHVPCTQRNALGTPHLATEALSAIPALRLHALPGNAVCCGAGGAYMLTQPAIANALRDDKVEQIQALAPDVLVTTNIGCALHLAAGLRAHGGAVRVVHPITLLAAAHPRAREAAHQAGFGRDLIPLFDWILKG